MFGRGDDSYIQEHQLKTSNVVAERPARTTTTKTDNKQQLHAVHDVHLLAVKLQMFEKWKGGKRVG